jgi:hypothetical protein
LLLQASAYESVCFFDLAIGLGVRYRSVLELDAEVFGEVLEFAQSEVGAVVGDNAVRDAVPVDNGLEELDRRGRLLVGDRNNFYPLGELVHCDE